MRQFAARFGRFLRRLRPCRRRELVCKIDIGQLARQERGIGVARVTQYDRGKVLIRKARQLHAKSRIAARVLDDLQTAIVADHET